jgi:AbrB family looped-hinge helix DNA binding protein
MSICRVRDRGQVTIPSELRKQLHLENNATLDVTLIGDALVMTPYPSRLDKAARKFEREMKKQSLTLENVLKDLKTIRKGNARERYGI